MFRRIVPLLVACVLILAGCGRQPNATDPVSVDFSCQFRAQYDNMTAAGTLTRHTAGTLLLEFSEPETLSGIAAQWDGENITLKYQGLTFQVDPADLPESALGEELIAAFDAALRGEGDRQTQDGRVIVTGLSGNSEYTYVYDAATGAPLSLSVPALPLTVTFSDIQTHS